MKKNKSKFIALFLSIAIIISVWSLISYSLGKFSPIENVVASVVSPAQSVFMSLGKFFTAIPDYFQSKNKLIAENDSLKSEIAVLRRENEKALSLQAENDWLYGFLELKREKSDYKFVNAKIISRSSGFVNEFTLNRGSAHGIEKNMCVITKDECLIGLIVEVGLNYSKGITLIDNSLSVGVYIERTGDPGILSGNYDLMSEGLCKIDNLQSNADIKIDDYVYTSGLGEVFPKSLSVGKITDIVPDPQSQTLSAIVKPAIELIDIDRVMVVTAYQELYE